MDSASFPTNNRIPRDRLRKHSAGPAGISAAAHLRNSPAAHGVDFEITVFEAGLSIGGQLAQFSSVSEGDGPVFPYNDNALDPLSAEDVAGPALLWGSPLFTRSSEDILGGDAVEFFDLPSQKVGYYSGVRHQIVLQMTRPYDQTPTWDWLGLVWRYGASVWRARGLLSEAADLSERLAANVAPSAAAAIADVPAILASLLGGTALAHEGAPETLRRHGISEAYAAEVLAPQVERGAQVQRVPAMSGLALAMAAGREDAGRARAGGDYAARVRELAKALGADVRLNSKVVGIERETADGGDKETRTATRWLLRHEGGGAEAEAFDKVIMAAPGLEWLVVRAAGVNGSIETDQAVEFDAAHVTFFTASELPGRFGGGDGAVPPQILFVDDDAEGGIHEVAYVREVVPHHRDGVADGAPVVEHLYRCVSGADVSEALASDPGVTWMHHRRFDHAYPLTYPRTSYPSFGVDDGLWTTTPIYSVGSSLDLSWLAGRAVAQQVIEAVKK
ncbi:hypothetical protein DL764_009486 [Monosporascus ibericus]|uniref:Prenylcysteine lyase domain-containing protein n=1 Tax=Monosporascus ibericus TaxID=155417 RepID=A0A4Q4SXR3_9PEZI|nr:hypothetical protein DL764_009486 [Monosporascus ibericus]